MKRSMILAAAGLLPGVRVNEAVRLGRVRNSAASSAIVNETLSNFASSVAPDLGQALAGWLAPQVPTGLTSGQFMQFETDDSFQIYETRRALGGKRNRIEFNKDDPSFNCRPNGLEVTIDDHERLGARKLLNLQQAKMRTLTRNIGMAHEKAVFDKVAATEAEAGLGNWSDEGVDPIDEMDSVIDKIALRTGIMPTRMFLELGTLRKIRKHPRVRARFPAAQRLSITAGDIAALLINPNIDIRVGVLGYNAAKKPAASNMKRIGASNVFIFVGSDTPTQEDPSWAKTFAAVPLNEASIKEYRDESCNSDVYANDWDIDIRIVSSLCGARIAVQEAAA
jgi:hypothetical protein